MDAKLIRRLCYGAIGITIIVFAIALISLFVYRRDQLLAQAESQAKSDLYMASNLISDRLNIARTAIVNSPPPEETGQSKFIVENLLHHNPDIYGTAIAIEPEYAKTYLGMNRFMIYSYRTDADSLSTFLISDSIEKYYRYPERDWYRFPVENRAEHWSEPYHDSLTSGALMVSYSAPIVMPDSTVVGVLLADITLDKGIDRIIEEVDYYPDHRTFLLSNNGTLVFGDTTNIANEIVYTQSLPETGWTLGHVMNRDTLFRQLHKEIFNMALLFVLTVVILCITIYTTIHLMSRPAVKRQMRIKAELDIATHIQEGMLPQNLPTSPLGSPLDIAASIKPAKEVGGDFYNYFREEDKFYFIIGDVSGKGIPAALIMAIATKLFRFSAPGKNNAAEIMGDINRILCHDNKENMFVTAIVGILDTTTRRLSLCNAGHMRPILIGTDMPAGDEFVNLAANIPAGVMGDYAYESEAFDFPEGSKLILYTDGVTEAENARLDQFGAQRLLQVVRENRTAPASRLCTVIAASLASFTSTHPQSDDLTLLIIS